MSTPSRKRPCSEPPSSSSPRGHHKRLRTEALLMSPSPKTIRLAPENNGEDVDAILESDVPESPIRQPQETGLSSVSFASSRSQTPSREITDPFSRLNIKSSAHKRNLSTPVAVKLNSEGPKSVKKSARKTPGSAKSSKVLPFRIKVFLRW
jgi:hypothetical protein